MKYMFANFTSFNDDIKQDLVQIKLNSVEFVVLTTVTIKR
jgi:hypothetical protein